MKNVFKTALVALFFAASCTPDGGNTSGKSAAPAERVNRQPKTGPYTPKHPYKKYPDRKYPDKRDKPKFTPDKPNKNPPKSIHSPTKIII